MSPAPGPEVTCYCGVSKAHPNPGCVYHQARHAPAAPTEARGLAWLASHEASVEVTDSLYVRGVFMLRAKVREVLREAARLLAEAAAPETAYVCRQCGVENCEQCQVEGCPPWAAAPEREGRALAYGAKGGPASPHRCCGSLTVKHAPDCAAQSADAGAGDEGPVLGLQTCADCAHPAMLHDGGEGCNVDDCDCRYTMWEVLDRWLRAHDQRIRAQALTSAAERLTNAGISARAAELLGMWAAKPRPLTEAERHADWRKVRGASDE